MLKARIGIDLPGVDVLRGLGPLEWVRSIFGASIDRRSGTVETTVSAWSLLEGLYRAFRHAQVNDAVSYVVDRRAIYVDTQEVTHDLELVWEAAQERDVLQRPFREMHLVLTQHRAGIHLLYDVRITSRVMEGDPHLTVEISGRPEDLKIRPGESAPEYGHRIRHLTANDAGLESYRQVLDVISTELAGCLEREVPGARAVVEESRVQLVRPGTREVGRFRDLLFGPYVSEPRYRPAPSKARSGAYADPFVYYWYDPYWSLTNWFLLDAMMHHGHWHTPAVQVVDESGKWLYDGSQAPSADPGWAGEHVSVGEGGVHVDSVVPDAGGAADPVGAVSDSAFDSWGSSDTSASDGWGSSDFAAGDSGSSGSSCGSSCSGGSSCGGGCGGGGGGD